MPAPKAGALTLGKATWYGVPRDKQSVKKSLIYRPAFSFNKSYDNISSHLLR